MRIQLKDGTYEWIDTPKQLNQLIEKYIGKDAVECLFSFIDPVRDKLDNASYYSDRDLDMTDNLIKDADMMLDEVEKGI